MFKRALTHKHSETDNNEQPQTGTSTERCSQQETNWQRRVQANRLRTTHADRHRLRLPHKDTSQQSAETKARLAQSSNGVRMLHNGLRRTYRWHLNVKFPKIKEGSGEFSFPALAGTEEYYRAKPILMILFTEGNFDQSEKNYTQESDFSKRRPRS